jgi:hypothetical protein
MLCAVLYVDVIGVAGLHCDSSRPRYLSRGLRHEIVDVCTM